MNNQEIFDTVAKHLLTQNKQSLLDESPVDVTGCAYRATDGCKCAVGVLIKDEFYNPSLEGLFVNRMAVRKALRKSGVATSQKDTLDLLGKLQLVHDNDPVKEWSKELQYIAERFGLQFNPPSP